MRVRGASLSIGTWLLLIFFVVVTGVGVGVPIVTAYQQDRAVRRMALDESRRTSQLVFDHLYSVMRKGWSRDEIDEILDRINRHEVSATVFAWRGPVVASEYGEHAPSAAIRQSDPMIQAVLDDGADRLEQSPDGVRYLYPVIAEEECLPCHTEARVGDVNGIIDVRFPTEQLRVPLAVTLRSATWIYAAGAGVLFVLLFVMLRWLITRPIVELSDTMTHIVARDDLGRRLLPRRLWPREVRLLASDFNVLMGKLEDSREELLQQSVRDPLTGAYNRRRFDTVLRGEVERARRYGRPLSVILVDLDRFKPINDRHGHAAGDAVLRAVAETLAERLRTTDVVARIGGDEFAVAAPETDAAQAKGLAAELSACVAERVVTFGGHALRVGASCGAATLDPASDEGAAELLARADTEMYRIKQARHAARA